MKLGFKIVPVSSKYFEPVLIIQTVHIVNLIENYNIVKKHGDLTKINNQLISIYIKINRYNRVCHTHLLYKQNKTNGY